MTADVPLRLTPLGVRQRLSGASATSKEDPKQRVMKKLTHLPRQDLAYIKPHITKHLPWSTFLSHYQSSLSQPLVINEALFRYGAAYSVMRTYLG